MVAVVRMLNWAICSAAHSEMNRRSSAAKPTIDAKALPEMMLCGLNATFAASKIVTVVICTHPSTFKPKKKCAVQVHLTEQGG